MSDSKECILTQDCPAVQIPSGDPVVLKEGSRVYITQTLGGSFTVMTDSGLARIEGNQTEALGLDPSFLENLEQSNSKEDHAGPPDEAAIWDQLRNVYDPEIPVNIVDLGLVYSLEVKDIPDKGFHSEIQMTLTAPGCGMGPAIAEDAKTKVLLVPGLKSAEVNLVWDPPWTQEMISEAGKMTLGLI
ncbi:MAG: putative Fe-S cluster assembly protein SufT [Opitutaceae bacterium]|nr:putative Fe-S cluster assembly protein SufT [Opitutaceae bacterium]